MRIEKGFEVNCSEAVFRFYTVEPKEIQKILESIRLSVLHNKDAWKNGCKKPIPLFKKAEMYDTGYTGKPSYALVYEGGKGDKEIKQVMSHEEAIKKAYPKGSLMEVCAGLGDNEVIVTVNKDNFTLNIGNNDIGKEWVETVKSMGIEVEEAEYSEELRNIARDCTCGLVFFEGYSGRKA